MAIPPKIGDFTVLPITYSSQAIHYLYIRPHESKNKVRMADDLPNDRTLFLVNVPPDATERDLVTLFSSSGTVDRVSFGGHAVDEEEDFSDENEESEESEMEVDNPVENKTKRERKKDVVPVVVPLPSVPLRHLRKTGSTAHIVFTNPQSLSNALSIASSSSSKGTPPLVWPRFKASSAAEPTGLAHYLALYKSLRPPLSSIKEHAESSMQVYDYKLAQANKHRNTKYKKGEAIVDEDGFTLVTRGGAYGKTLGGGVGVASKQFMTQVVDGKGVAETAARRKKQRRANTDGLYAFQIREKQIKEQIAMKKEYEKDKQKVDTAKQQRKYKPY